MSSSFDLICWKPPQFSSIQTLWYFDLLAVCSVSNKCFAVQMAVYSGWVKHVKYSSATCKDMILEDIGTRHQAYQAANLTIDLIQAYLEYNVIVISSGFY